MSMKKGLLGAVMLVGLALASQIAHAATITFEDGTAPTVGPVPVGTYSVNGVDVSFANATYSSDYPYAISGVMTISQYVRIGPEGVLQLAPIEVIFSQPVASVSIWAIAYGTGSQLITSIIEAYGQSGQLLDMNSHMHGRTDPSGNTSYPSSDLALLSVAASNIYSLRLSGQWSIGCCAGGTSRFDDMSVNVSAVPLPAALPLLASGLGALGVIGWRNKRKENSQPRNFS